MEMHEHPFAQVYSNFVRSVSTDIDCLIAKCGFELFHLLKTWDMLEGADFDTIMEGLAKADAAAGSDYFELLAKEHPRILDSIVFNVIYRKTTEKEPE